MLQTATPASTTSTVTIPMVATQVGTLIVIATYTGNGTTNPVASISDGAHTYTRALQNTSAAVEIWYTITTVSVTSILVTFTGNTGVSHIAWAREYNDIKTSSMVDQVTSGSGSSTTPATAASSATTNANNLIFVFGCHAASSTITAGSGYKNLSTKVDAGSGYSPFIEDKLVTATGTQTGNATGTAITQWGIGLVAFMLAGVSNSSTIQGISSITGASKLQF